MNEYLSRSEISPVDRVSARAPSAVASVQAVEANGQKPDLAPRTLIEPAPAAKASPATDIQPEDQLASAAEYVSVHARIAGILADLRTVSTREGISVDGAAAAIQAMMPAPIIIVPLPPASREQVEHAALLAKRMADQAVQAHAAQAHLRPGTVDAALSAVV
jgi:hypothetical protein